MNQRPTEPELFHALHEAAHAVVSLYHDMPVSEIAVGRRQKTDGTFTMGLATVHWDPERPDAQIAVCLAGPMAEEKYFSRRIRYSKQIRDEAKALELATETEGEDNALDAVEDVRRDVKELLRRPSVWGKVEQLAYELMKQRCMGKDTILRIVGGSGEELRRKLDADDAYVRRVCHPETLKYIGAAV